MTFFDNVSKYIREVCEPESLSESYPKYEINHDNSDYLDHPIDSERSLNILFYLALSGRGVEQYKKYQNLTRELARVSEDFSTIESREYLLTVFMTHYIYRRETNSSVSKGMNHPIFPEFKRLFYLTASDKFPEKHDVAKIIGIGKFLGDCLFSSEFKFVRTLLLDRKFEYVNRMSLYDMADFCYHVALMIDQIETDSQCVFSEENRKIFFEFLGALITSLGYMNYRFFSRTGENIMGQHVSIVPGAHARVKRRTFQFRRIMDTRVSDDDLYPTLFYFPIIKGAIYCSGCNERCDKIKPATKDSMFSGDINYEFGWIIDSFSEPPNDDFTDFENYVKNNLNVL